MRPGTEWLDTRKCIVCGKRFAVLYPHLWRYKRGSKYLCSYSCSREFDRKEAEYMNKETEKPVRRDRIEIAKKIVEMGKTGQGGAPVIAYLESLGYSNPVQALADIRKYCKEKQPALYDDWPVQVRGKKTTEGAEEAREPEVPPAEEKATEQKCTKPLVYDGFEVTAVRSALAEFTYDRKHGTVDMHTVDGQELILLPNEWKKLEWDIGRILKILGAET